MKWKLTLIIALIFSTLGINLAFSELTVKHPRVAELEDKLARDGSTYIKGRFPDKPFLVTVSVDPLRRAGRGGGDEKEKIPFLDLQSEEIQDEWDDPQISLQQLMLRVRRATVSVSLPDSIADDESEEIKTSLYSVLHLTPARDSVDVVRKKWSTSGQQWNYAALAGGTILFLLLGFYFISHRTASTFAAALRELKIQSTGGAAPGPTYAHLNTISALPIQGTSSPGGKSGDGERNLKLSDPIRIRELIRGLIESVTAHDHFPTLSDILTLNDYGKYNPSGLGSILVELPPLVQKKLFGITGDIPHWLDAFHKPDNLGIESLNILEKLARTARDDADSEWEKLLIYIWRLGISAASFLQTVEYEHAMTILSALPKSVSIRIARWAFPGNWGSLLKYDNVLVPLSTEQIREISQRALETKPLASYKNLKQYRSDLELLDYLRIAEIAEERDIYGAAPHDSFIHKVRKPFYPIFDQEEETLRSIVPKIAPEEWAMALLNVAIPDRKKVDALFTEKQKFLFIERLRYYDANPPGRHTIAQSRDKIASLLAQHLKGKTRTEAQKDAA